MQRISVTNSGLTAAGKVGLSLNGYVTTTTGFHTDRISDATFFSAAGPTYNAIDLAGNELASVNTLRNTAPLRSAPR